MKEIKHEMNIQGNTDYNTFMNEINNQLSSSGFAYEKLDLDGAI